MTLVITIWGKPTPAGRPRVFKNGGVSYPKAHTTYIKEIRPTLAENKPDTITGLVSVNMLFVFPKYKTSDYPTYRADLDNLAKIPLDEMTKQEYWSDDSLVSELVLTKRFANENEEPHTTITITEQEDKPE